MRDLKELIKEVLSNYNTIKPKCNCGCHTCKNVGNPGPVLNENLNNKFKISKNLQYHINNKLPLTENTFRYGSESFLNLWLEARHLYSRDTIYLNDTDKEIINETNLGEYGIYEGKMVPLDLPMVEENTDDVVAILNNPNIEDDVKSMLFNAYKSGKLTSTQVIDIIKKTVKEHLNEAEFKGKEVQLAGTISRNGKDLVYIDTTDGERYEYQTTPEEYQLFINSGGNAQKMMAKSWLPKAILHKPIDHPLGRLGMGKGHYIDEAEFKGKEVQLGKPKRGGAKKFYVYVKDPKTKKVKKVSFGDTTGLSAKINNPKARKAFAARHKCGTGEPKTSAKY